MAAHSTKEEKFKDSAQELETEQDETHSEANQRGGKQEEFNVYREIKRLKGEVAVVSKKHKKLINRLTALHEIRRNKEGKERVALKDEEFACILETMMADLKTGKGAIRKCAISYNKSADWQNRVYAYKPISEQVDRVIEKLKSRSNRELKLIESHRLFDKKKLLKRPMSAVLSNLRQAVLLANDLEQKQLEIHRLNIEVQNLKEEIMQKDILLKRFEIASPEERVRLTMKQYPEKSLAEIARLANVSRPTVYKYKEKLSKK